jgi:ABC-type cobalamin transport system permease subunit
MAIAGFVLSLIGLFPGFWFWILQIPAYLGTIFSIVGLKATRARRKRGRGLAIAGLVIGLIGIVAAALFTIYVYTSDDCDVDGLFEFSCSIN